ncbi:MAG: hypothetical protein R3C02_07900 [Planctomycetaceae bacterium]
MHPKVAALLTVVREIVEAEICRLLATPDAWFSKVLIFNKLIRGTAPQLTQILGEFVSDAFDGLLDELLASTETNRDDLGSRVRQAVDEQLMHAERALKNDPAFSAWYRVPDEFAHEDFVGYRGRSILQVFREPLRPTCSPDTGTH